MRWFIILSITVILSIIPSAISFECYVCDSKDDNECMENLPKDTKLKPQVCSDIIEPKYCIKTTNMYAGELGTKRFCAAKDMGTYCKYVRQPTGDREHRSCISTCSSENCNVAFRANELTLTEIYVGLISILFTYILTTNIKTFDLVL